MIIKVPTENPEIYCYYIDVINRIVFEGNICTAILNTDEHFNFNEMQTKFLKKDLEKIYKQQFQNT